MMGLTGLGSIGILMGGSIKGIGLIMRNVDTGNCLSQRAMCIWGTLRTI